MSKVAELVGELTDGNLSAEGREELRRSLADDPQALEWYAQWMQVHALLYLDLRHPSDALLTPDLSAAELLRPPLPTTGAGRWTRNRWTLGLSAASIAAAASLLMFAYGAFQPKARETAANRFGRQYQLESEQLDAFQRTDESSVAVLSQAADVRWSGARPLSVGSPVPAGRLAIDSGLVQLDFLSGANIVVEGPADLELVSSMLIVCRRGKLRAHVPAQAKGFVIETPRHRAVDLGTEFAVNVGDDQGAEVHVLDGEVEVFDKERTNVDGKPRSLTIGDALRALPNGEVSEMAAAPDEFVSVERLLSLSEEDSATRYARWRLHSLLLRDQPNVVAYYSFEGQRPWQRVLQQDGAPGDRSLDGAIVGCRWADGRWPGKQALEFKSTEDRIRLNVPGEFESLSLACWVRIDGFDRWLSSLLLTDGHNLGEVHWQFTTTGRLLLGVKAEPDQSQEYLTETVLRPADLGRWIHLACVYNSQAKEVIHYVDGRRVKSHPIVKGTPLRIGPAEVGNWVPQELKDHRIRSLNGRIDELALFKTALADDEIQAMHEAGRPN